VDPQLIKELAAVLGPSGVVLAVILTERARRGKEPADPRHDLTEEVLRDAAALHREVAEARDEQRREVADLRKELAAVREALAGMRATVEYLKERGK
jgi:hypothetical protein